MPCPPRRKATYGTKQQARVHGAITYGSGNYVVRAVKDGWRAYPKNPRKRKSLEYKPTRRRKKR